MRALVVRPDLICTDVCARLDRPMCTLQSAKCKVQMCSIVGPILFALGLALALDLARALDRPSGADVVLCESCVISLVVSLFLLFVLC